MPAIVQDRIITLSAIINYIKFIYNNKDLNMNQL